MGLQARIVDRPAHGEVVEHLKAVAREPEDPVGEVVEEAADAGAADAACFGLEVEELSDDAGLPIQAAVEPGPERLEGRAVLGEHGRCEDAVGGDFLIAARLLGDPARIPLLQEEERQGRGAPAGSVQTKVRSIGVSSACLRAGSRKRA